MRAKRSKKYRKLMSNYSLSFSFHPPYQVLLDSNFLRQCHRFHMPIRQFLSNTLQGEIRPMVSECTLQSIMNGQEQQTQQQAGTNGNDGQPRQGQRHKRPDYLPPPTELPLRYCKHETQRTELLERWTETDCLLDLIAGMARGGEQKKNKWHYVLATADAEEKNDGTVVAGGAGAGRVRKKQEAVPFDGATDLRVRARLIPGVPIVYVKRSVMVLEEMSGASDRALREKEREKLKSGLVTAMKRKSRDDDDEEKENEFGGEFDDQQRLQTASRGMRKARGPNPMSVLKKKTKVVDEADEGRNGAVEATPKAKRRRKHGTKGDEQVDDEVS